MKTKFKYLLAGVAATAAVVATVASADALGPGAKAESGIDIPRGYSTLVFADEFTDAGIPDASLWGCETGYVRNGEMQYYTDGANARVDGGMLIIEGRNDSIALPDGAVAPITSASLTALKPFRYGYVEVRADIPSFRGSWPAIWLLPSENIFGEWPRSGEIDILEHVGYAPENIHFAAHTERYNHMRGVQKNCVCPAADAVDGFHTYGLEWTPTRLIWYYDGTEQYALDKEEGADWTSWPFDNDFYLILNLAIGGGWGGQQGVDLEALPAEYKIDYVRIFQ